MALEIATYIEELVSTNPVGGTDQLSTADDHLRLIKAALKATMPGFGGRIKRVDDRSSNFAAALAHNHVMFRCTSVLTVTLTAPATIGNGCEYIVFNDASPSGTITVTPAVGTINGLASLAIPAGMAAFIWCDGTNYYAIRVVITAGTMAQQDASSVNITGGSIAVAAGGTGANTAAGARTNLGLGSLAVLNSVGAAQIDTGAVGQSEVANGAIGRGELITTTAVNQVSVNDESSATLALSGGAYSWVTFGANFSGTERIIFGGSNTVAGTLGVANIGTAAATFYVDERYVQASPPYTHGPLYVMLMLDKLGNVANIAIAPDPIWAYHGPTDITPQYRRNRKAYRRVKRYDGLCLQEFVKDPTRKRRYLNGDCAVEEVEQEITLAYKDSDMHVIPHPWVYNPSTYFAEKTIVMLEPGTSLMGRLYELLEQSHAKEVKNLILDDYLTIDNTPLNLSTCPSGVMMCRANWKLTQ